MASGEKAPSLPPGFTEIRQALDKQVVAAGSMINLIGLTKDFMRPRPFGAVGGDYKATLTMVDFSCQGSNYDIQLHIFRPENAIPLFEARDVVVLYNVKVQDYKGPRSLLVNFR